LTRRWPDGLPAPVGRGYQLELADMARRTDFEVAIRARRITTVRRDRPTLAGRLTDAEFEALRAWWGDEAWSLAGASDSLSGWTFAGASRGAGAAVGPDGVLYDALVEDEAAGEHRAWVTLADPGWGVDDSATAVVSLLPIGRSAARVTIVGRDNIHRNADVDLATRGIIGLSAGVSVSVSAHGDWSRVRLTAKAGFGATPMRLRIGARDGAGVSYTGSGAAALAIGQINVLRGDRSQAIFVPTRADGTALGAAGGSAWFRCPIAVGGGHVRREVLPLGALAAEPMPSLNWSFTLQVEARDA
jgi:hypothetical protein